MKFRCKKCTEDVVVPRDLEPGGDVVRCRGCGARYRKKGPGSASQTSGPALDHGATTHLSPSPDGPVTAASPSQVGMTATAGAVTAPSVAARSAAGGAAKRDHHFQAGDLVAQRYGIVRYVARGGMGEVYLAEDVELSEHVALKTVRTQGQDPSLAIERLKREIQLARRVTHPNVCRIFDVGRHLDPTGQSSTTFLTMEFLEGTTISRRLRHAGPLAPTDALPLVCQMAEALHAAHRAGIVHRDFKSDNVMLVPGDDGPRAVVTDFGIARATKEDPRDIHLTGKGVLVGTPAYMAPEQVSGGAIGPATDLYALGVVMYEMVTGRVPFLGDSALNTAALRLTTPPPSPREHRPDLPDKWETAILRCLEIDPQKRFSDALELVTYLRGEEVFTEDELAEMEAERQRAIAAERRRAEAARRETDVVKQQSRKGYRTRVLLLSLLVVSILALVMHNVARQLDDQPTLTFELGPVNARSSVAVTQLANTSGRDETEWLATALAEMLTTELSSDGQLRVIPGANVARAMLELDVPGTESLTADRAGRLAENLGADYLVGGSYVALGDGQLRVDLRVRTARSGEIVASIAETGEEAQLFDLVGSVGAMLRDQLSLESATTPRTNPLPADREAARLYSEGLDRLRAFAPAEARELLERAQEREPSNALIHSTLSTAYSALGYQALALQAARRAFDLSTSLPEADRLLIEGQYRESAAEWARAADVYEALWRSTPDNLEYGLRFVSAAISDGRAREALAAVDALRRLPSPASGDPRIDLAEAAAAAADSQLVRQTEAARRAREKALQVGAVLLAARASVTEAEALREQGLTDPATAASEEALRLFRDRQHQAGAGLALTELANVRFATGDYERAIALQREALAAFEEVGDQSAVLRSLNNLAVILRVQGRFAEAAERYEELLRVARRVENPTALENGLNNLGAVFFSQGQLPEARRRFEEALEVARERGQRTTVASILGNLAAVDRWSGDLEGANRLHEESLAIRREIGQGPGEALSLIQLATLALDHGDLDRAEARLDGAAEHLAEVELPSLEADLAHARGELAAARGQFDQAQDLFEQALGTFTELGARAKIDRCRLSLGRLALDTGTPGEATSHALAVTGALEAPATSRESILATALLAEAVARQGEGDEARATATLAAERAADMPIPLVALWVDFARAHAAMAGGRVDEAYALLEPLQVAADEAGLVELSLRARLALAEADRLARSPERADDRLAAVLRDAQRSGQQRLVLLARDLESTPTR